MDSQERKDTYTSISAPSQGIYKEKGSKFLAFAYPVESEEEIKATVGRLRKEYHDARHHCYAYRLGADGSAWRYNDDGEPSSTAGKPIYGQLLSNGLSDILIVVVRYFGGIKLGVPGLIKAYRSAAADAIANSRTVEKTASSLFSVTFGYAGTDRVMRILKDMGISPAGYTAGTECRIEAKVRLRDTELFIKRMQDAEAIVEYI